MSLYKAIFLMTNRISLLLLTLIISLPLGGCFFKEPPEQISSIDEEAISLLSFAKKYKLKLKSSPDKYTFSTIGERLSFYPGLKVANHNGRIISLPKPLQVDQGRMLIPLSIIDTLPESILSRVEKPRPYTVIIDAGHGGHDSGAQRNGILEKNINLDIALRLKKILTSRGISALLTRKDDTFIELEDRSLIANNKPGAIFVSIHVNSASATDVNGIETFYLTPKISDNERAKIAACKYEFSTPGESLSLEQCISAARSISAKARRESLKLAQIIQDKMLEGLRENDRGVKSENFSVLRENFFGPAILVETGFISHSRTRRNLAQPQYRQKIARSLALGVQEFIDMSNNY